MTAKEKAIPEDYLNKVNDHIKKLELKREQANQNKVGADFKVCDRNSSMYSINLKRRMFRDKVPLGKYNVNEKPV